MRDPDGRGSRWNTTARARLPGRVHGARVPETRAPQRMTTRSAACTGVLTSAFTGPGKVPIRRFVSTASMTVPSDGR